MAHSRLLLLIGLISFRLPDVQGRHIDFWCNNQAREKMLNMIENLKKHMADCMGSDTLPSPIQLPCVYIRIAEWKNKTVQQKFAEVKGAIQVFHDGVKRATNQTSLQNSSSECHTSVLRKLERRIRNYLTIVNKQNDTAQSAVQHCSIETSLNAVLRQYENLLRGKLERLVVDLQDSMCKGEHTITNNYKPWRDLTNAGELIGSAVLPTN